MKQVLLIDGGKGGVSQFDFREYKKHAFSIREQDARLYQMPLKYQYQAMTLSGKVEFTANCLAEKLGLSLELIKGVSLTTSVGTEEEQEFFMTLTIITAFGTLQYFVP